MHELFNQCETLQAFQSVGDNAAAISMKTGEVIQMSDGGGGGGGEGGDAPVQSPISSIKLSWKEGVLMPCLLNIWGVMLFLRLTWVIGQAGILQGLALMTIANVVTFLTAISMSAVCTNGQIKGGGVYYMISRSLGPEFGGAIGLMFTLANSIAVAMYVIGFCESLLDMLTELHAGEFGGIVDNGMNDVRIIGCGTVFILLIIAIVGMEWITRVQTVLLVLLIFSQIDFIIGSFLPSNIEEQARGFTGWNYETFTENLSPHYNGQTFWTVFSVFFPAVTGITAGANMSGDLKDPAKAIPQGTFLAIIVTYITYMCYGLMIGSVYLSNASGSVAEYIFTMNGTGSESELLYTDCFSELRNVSCRYGTVNDQQTMATISVSKYLIYGGCFAATLSSAIASLVGAPRVLQALAKDKLYPGLDIFGKGSGSNNDPVNGYILVFIISVICILIGDLNIVSGLLSNFFVASYGLINFSSFHASITKSPGWRPSFKYFNPWVSLVGCILCVCVMFLMDYLTAILTFIIICVLYFWIHYRKPEANWGSSTQAAIFVSALKSVQTLTDTPEHVKNFRPKVLVLSGNPTHRIPLIDFGNIITKKLSLLICSHVLRENKPKNTIKLKEDVQDWMKKQKVVGFYNVVQNTNFEEGAEACLALSGLGKLSPNMLLLGFKQDWAVDLPATRQYVSVWQKAYNLNLSVLVLRTPRGLDYSNHILEEELVEAEDRDPVVVVEQFSDTVRPEISRKISVEPSGGRKKKVGKSKVSVDRAQVGMLGKAINMLVFGGDNHRDIGADIREFRDKKRRGNLDIWWLFDDGGMPVLLGHILKSRMQFADCNIRVFTLGSEKLERQTSMFAVLSKSVATNLETKHMREVLTNFRINSSDVTVISNMKAFAKQELWDNFREKMRSLPEGSVSEDEISQEQEFINKHLRLSEELQRHSSNAQMILLTLPQQFIGTTNTAIYMAAIDLMTSNLPPTLLVGGNNVSVLTALT